jgi:hypothetical protein
LVIELYCPAEQGAQVRSVFSVGAAVMNVPGWHVVTGVHAAAVLLSSEYVFNGQAEHTGAVVAEGWVEAY